MIDLNPVYEALIRKRTMADIAAIENYGGKINGS
jgi:hypothetical protein